MIDWGEYPHSEIRRCLLALEHCPPDARDRFVVADLIGAVGDLFPDLLGEADRSETSPRYPT